MNWTDTITKYVQQHAAEWGLKAVAALAVLVGALIVGRMLAGWARRGLERADRATLGGLAAKLVGVVALVLGIVLALDQIGIDVTALIAGAGILGLAVGFGAQALVKDVITGFFLIFDDVLREGDVAKVGDVTGVVESVGLRMTQVRAFDGQLFYIPNGQITSVGSYSRDWCRAVVNVGVAYEGDVQRGLEVLQGIGDAWAKEHEDIVLEPPEAQGVISLGASDVGLRLVIKVKAGEHVPAERQLRKIVKDTFDAEKVEIPFPRQVLYLRKDDEGATADAS